MQPVLKVAGKHPLPTSYGLVVRVMCSYHRNSFPPQYQGINEAQLPGELFQEAVSVEYLLQQPSRTPPAFVLCLDLAQSPDALEVTLCCTITCAIVETYAELMHGCILMMMRKSLLYIQEMKQSIKQMLQMLPDY